MSHDPLPTAEPDGSLLALLNQANRLDDQIDAALDAIEAVQHERDNLLDRIARAAKQQWDRVILHVDAASDSITALVCCTKTIEGRRVAQVEYRQAVWSHQVPAPPDLEAEDDGRAQGNGTPPPVGVLAPLPDDGQRWIQAEIDRMHTTLGPVPASTDGDPPTAVVTPQPAQTSDVVRSIPPLIGPATWDSAKPGPIGCGTVVVPQYGGRTRRQPVPLDGPITDEPVGDNHPVFDTGNPGWPPSYREPSILDAKVAATTTGGDHD